MQQIVIVAPPRSGASLVHTLLSATDGWTSSGLGLAAGVDVSAGMSARERNFVSDRLTSRDASTAWAEVVRRAVSVTATANPAVIVDWDPAWSIRVGALAEALPEARFLLVHRREESVVASMVEAWRSRRFVSMPDLPGWWGEQWSFPLTPGWAQLRGLPLAAVCAGQWSATTNALVEDLGALPAERWSVLGFEELLGDPSGALRRACAQLGIDWPGDALEPLPIPATAVTPPASGKWQGSRAEVLNGLGSVEASRLALRALIETRRPDYTWPEAEVAPVAPAPAKVDSAHTPFKTEYTASIADLLRQAEMTIAISTYKSGHVILARHDEGEVNVEFHALSRPMGIAVSPSRVAIGTTETIDAFTANSAVAPRVPSPRPVDIAYMPRTVTFTGDVSIHDMAYDDAGQLHFVNTRFSCLCRPDADFSFVPTWIPPWISALAAEDRCHLNGLAMVDGNPRYVTALSRTDSAAGWRELKGTSGVIVDITDNRVVTEGLSMPHSPRWHDGKLWVLESGKGTLATVDVATGAVTTVATLPGFTRGLTFVGQYALIGLSQVRESVFSALPVTEQKEERNCGVWLVDTANGAILGWLKFDGIVQEIFDVRMLPAQWPTFVQRGDISRTSFLMSSDALAKMDRSGTV